MLPAMAGSFGLKRAAGHMVGAGSRSANGIREHSRLSDESQNYAGSGSSTHSRWLKTPVLLFRLYSVADWNYIESRSVTCFVV